MYHALDANFIFPRSINQSVFPILDTIKVSSKKCYQRKRTTGSKARITLRKWETFSKCWKYVLAKMQVILLMDENNNVLWLLSNWTWALVNLLPAKWISGVALRNGTQRELGARPSELPRNIINYFRTTESDNFNSDKYLEIWTFDEADSALINAISLLLIPKSENGNPFVIILVIMGGF